MTAATSATRTEDIRLIREIMESVKPEHLTGDELATVVVILKAAEDRKEEPIRARVVYLDVVRSGRRARP
jgi:hypothetical protein